MNRPPEIIRLFWMEQIIIEEDAEFLEPVWVEPEYFMEDEI